MRGYHVYKDIWEAPIAEVLACRKEEGNVHDPYCVAVIDRHEVPSGMFPGRSVRSVPYSWITKEQFHAKKSAGGNIPGLGALKILEQRHDTIPQTMKKRLLWHFKTDYYPAQLERN